MAINISDIKLMQSQNLNDTDEGGGLMTIKEVVDGNVNNLFPDISRLDRVYGRVSMRKAYLSVRTDNRDTYYGSHVVLTEQAQDPLVTVTAFTTKNWFDERANAVDRVQAYLAVGTQYMAVFYGNHYTGSKLVNLLAEPTQEDPKINDVLIFKDESDWEYVRIIDVESKIIIGTDDKGEFEKKQITLEINTGLVRDYEGEGASRVKSYSTVTNPIHISVVADAAKYYGVTDLKTSISSGDFSLKVNSIFQNIVPSAQSSSAVIDYKPYEVVKKWIQAGNEVQSGSYSWTFPSKMYFSTSILPGSFKVYLGSDLKLYDDGEGLVYLNWNGWVVYGNINYDTGVVTKTYNISGTASNYYHKYMPACEHSFTARSRTLPINLGNRGFIYVFDCTPTPESGTLRVDYLAGGNWYSLHENGEGVLKNEENASLGTGTFNPDTGTVSLTLGYMPDIDSSIYFYWSKDISSSFLTPGDITPTSYKYQVEGNLTPNSLEITWEQDGEVKTITDNNGLLKQDGIEVGQVTYGSGSIYFEPNCTPLDSTIFNFDYTCGAFETKELENTGNADWGETHRLEIQEIVLPKSISFFIDSWCRTYYSSTEEGINNAYARILNVSNKDGFDAPYVIQGNLIKRNINIIDDGLGNLVNNITKKNLGSIDYATGIMEFQGSDEITSEQLTYKYETCIIWSSFYSHYYSRKVLVEAEVEEKELHLYSSLTGKVKVCYKTIEGADIYSKAASFDKEYKIDSGNEIPLMPGSLRFTYCPSDLLDLSQLQLVDDGKGKLVQVFEDISTKNPLTELGTIDYENKIIKFTDQSENNSENLKIKIAGGKRVAEEMFVSSFNFKTPGTPVIPDSLAFQITAADGEELTAQSNLDGEITGSKIKGCFDSEYGSASIVIGEDVSNDAGAQSESWYHADNVSEDGSTVWKPIDVIPNSALMSCVITSYLPLNPDLLGLNPVRLPLDGKIKIFQDGDIVLIYNLRRIIKNTLTANEIVSMGRTNLLLIEIYDADGAYISESENYQADLENGTITMTDTLDLSDYQAPFAIYHRIEDLVLASDVQVTGNMTVISAIENNYEVADDIDNPTVGISRVCSVLPCGDLQAMIMNEFTQQSWSGEWSDSRIGNGILAQYNSVDYPIETMNKFSVQERFAFIFKSSNTIQIVGEHLGVIADDISILNDIAVPNNDTPYFIIRKEGWGGGWSTGNVFRFNETAANYPLWFIRTTLQGSQTEAEDKYVIQIRGQSSHS